MVVRKVTSEPAVADRSQVGFFSGPFLQAIEDPGQQNQPLFVLLELAESVTRIFFGVQAKVEGVSDSEDFSVSLALPDPFNVRRVRAAHRSLFGDRPMLSLG